MIGRFESSLTAGGANMPYIVDLFPIDVGGFIGIGPALNGTVANVSPTSATDTATATTTAPFRLSFATAMPPPPGVATIHVANSGPPGDIFRSGLLTAFPAAPGTVPAISVPTSLTTILAPALAARLAGVGGILLTPPGWVVALMAALSLGTFIPLTGAIGTVVPTLITPPASLTLTVTGFFVFRVGYFFTDTITFTGTLVTTPAPSGDVTQPSRILSVPCATSLSVATTGPSPTLALAGLFLSIVAPAVGGMAQSAIETLINDTINGLVAPGLAGIGFLRSPSAVVSARRVTITGSGLGLALVLSDLFGPAVIPIPLNFNVAVSPPPAAGTQRTYTVTVTNATTGASVPQADVTLHNFTANGTAQAVGPLQTDAGGHVTFNVALNAKISVKIIPEDHERVRVFTPPTLTVAKAGYNTFTLRLLEDPGAP